MKACPNCKRDIADTAIRCKYCRKPVLAVSRKPPVMAWLRKAHTINLEGDYPPWSIGSVLFLWAFVFAAGFALDYFDITGSITDFLKTRYFILIKEPALHFHIHVFTATFLLKLATVGVIWAGLKFHGNRFIRGLKLDTPLKKEWLWIFPVFFVFSAAVRLISGADPLSPNLPIYLFFKESSIIGNIITLSSLVIIAPFSEEIFFRGFMYPGLNKKLGLGWSVLITSVLFAAAHLPQCRDHPFILLSIFVGSILMTLARAVTQSTLIAVLLHAVYNGTIVLVGFAKFIISGY